MIFLSHESENIILILESLQRLPLSLSKSCSISHDPQHPNYWLLAASWNSAPNACLLTHCPGATTGLFFLSYAHQASPGFRVFLSIVSLGRYLPDINMTSYFISWKSMFIYHLPKRTSLMPFMKLSLPSCCLLLLLLFILLYHTCCPLT
jgi:hypothetical protein